MLFEEAALQARARGGRHATVAARAQRGIHNSKSVSDRAAFLVIKQAVKHSSEGGHSCSRTTLQTILKFEL
jgi:hypothetical protein